MGLVWASYYGLARVSEAGPEVKNWVVTDTNWQVTSLLLKRLEAHHHNAATPIRYPGYNTLNPATPATPLITQSQSGGYIAAGTNVGVRMSFVDQYGLETEASPEQSISMPAVVTRPNAIVAAAPVSTPVPGAVPGGTWIYAITKRLQTGESQLSDITTVDVPFDSTGLTSYTVPLSFDPISVYTDGTDSLCLYRTSGFDSAFVLLTTLTATPGLQNNTVAYTDTGAIQDVAHQPPQASEFGKQNMITIDWSNINIPNTAYRFRVYLTQQTGIWGNNGLFQDYYILDPATPFPTSTTFIGTETLNTGYPIDFTQIPYGAPLLNLTTEAIGGPVYTQAADAKGYPTYNFVFPDQSHATPVFANAYVDSSTGQFKIALATPGGVGQYSTLASVGAGYAHPTVEQGGHPASRIQFAPAVGGPTIDQIGSIIATPVPGPSQAYRKQATNLYKVTATPQTLQNSVVGGFQLMPDMDTISQWPTGISPSFPGQWFEVEFQSLALALAGTASGQVSSCELYINGSPVLETQNTFGGSHIQTGNSSYGQLNFTYATPLTRSNNRLQVYWQTSFGGYTQSLAPVPGQPPARYFLIKELF